jgi:hypothetical protein
LLLRSYSSKMIRHCLTSGRLGTGPLSPMARRSNLRIDRFAMRTRIDCAPDQRAATYLKRILALTGARRICGDTYFKNPPEKRPVLDCSWTELDAIGPKYFRALGPLILSAQTRRILHAHWVQHSRSDPRCSSASACQAGVLPSYSVAAPQLSSECTGRSY